MHHVDHGISVKVSGLITFAYNGKTKRDMIMKIFAICIGLVFGIFAIVVYAFSAKLRLKELTDKSDEKN